MAIGIQSDGSVLETTVSVKSGRKKLYDNKAKVVEGFREKHIKVDLVDEDDHYFKLNWNGSAYEGTFFGTTITSSYVVERDFKAELTFQGERKEVGEVVTALRSKGGRPNRYQE